MYNWYAVVGIYDAASANNPALRKKLAPTGWHVPTDTEWSQLTDCLSGEAIAGGKMKSTGTSLWQSPNTSATNESGFSGLPGGQRKHDVGTFVFIGVGGNWWSSTDYETANAWSRALYFSIGGAGRIGGDKNCGWSVRCLRD